MKETKKLPRSAFSVISVNDYDSRLNLEAQTKLKDDEKRRLTVELAGGAAHELNQPLTSILGYAELLAVQTRGRREDTEGRRYDRCGNSADGIHCQTPGRNYTGRESRLYRERKNRGPETHR